MMDRRIAILHEPRHRAYAKGMIDAAPDGYVVTVTEPTRTTDQNALLWPLLTDVSRQVTWYGRKLSNEDWKHIFTASLSKLDVVPNIDGSGFVALGQSTSRMGKRKFSELIELIFEFGARHGVVWSNHDDRGAA
ncbi:recombination protein NinB [Sinirhodobacter populi]|uniref:Recombination protein NinB n=1 Tax=Paenirhodobacter populi TaxID=2306993 RepID=A0A443K7V0_9RHOB|nr:recombination protein NinB [Sinirhodobacter populi]RWR28806.1 recombination protein NinB [Sinirhodobacter populi]